MKTEDQIQKEIERYKKEVYRLKNEKDLSYAAEKVKENLIVQYELIIGTLYWVVQTE